MKILNGSTLEHIESSYGPLRDAVPCGLASCGTPHKRGFVVAFTSTIDAGLVRALMGHVCAEREFNEIWTKALARHHTEVQQNVARDRLRTFLEKANEIEPKLAALVPGLEARKKVRTELLIYATDFMRRCADACKNGRGRIGKQSDHKLDGQRFFLHDEALRKAKLTLGAIKLARQMAGSDSLTAEEISDKLSRTKNLQQDYEEIRKDALAGAAALRPPHLMRAIAVVGGGCLQLNGSVLWVYRRPYLDWVKVADLARVLDIGKT